MIIIKSEQYLSELGKQENNEDNGGWDSGNAYVVCDGSGVNALGEAASEIVAQTFINDLHTNPESDIASILARSEDRITKFVEKNPKGAGISTTIALLQFVNNNARIAWVGNSRIYHLRDGKILFKTKDHSRVNDSMDIGNINESDTQNPSKSNEITRLIQGSKKRTTAEEVICKDVRKNDYFLLCTTGILEAWSENELADVFQTTKNAETALQNLHEKCFQMSNDNYTAIIIQIEAVNNESPMMEGYFQEDKNPSQGTKPKGKSTGVLNLIKRNPLLIGGIGVLIFGVLVYFYQRNTSHDTLPEFNTSNAKGNSIDFVEDDIEKIEKKAVEEEEEYTEEIVEDRTETEPTSGNVRPKESSSNVGEAEPSIE